MLCPKCAHEIPEGSQFCNHCGTPLTYQGATTAINLNETAVLDGTGAISLDQGGTAPLNQGGTAPLNQGGTAPMPPVANQTGFASTQVNGYNTQATNYAPTQPGATPYAAPIVPPSPAAPTKKKKSKLPIILLILALIAAGVFAFTQLRGFLPSGPASSPTNAVENAAEAALDLDFDRMLDSLPPQMLEYGIERAGYANREELVTYLDNSVAELEEQTQTFGISPRSILKLISIETSDVSYYSDDGLAGLKEEWNSRIPGFGDTFQEAAMVTVDLSGQFDLFGQSISISDYLGSAPQHITTVKIDDQWYLLESDLSGLSDFSSML